MRNFVASLLFFLVLSSALRAQWTPLGLQSMPMVMTSDYKGIRFTNTAGPTPANGSVWKAFGTVDDWVTKGLRSQGGGNGLGCCPVERIDFLNDSLGFMLLSDFGLRTVWRTQDRAQTWQALAPSGQLAITPIADMRALNDTSVYLVAHGISAFSAMAVRVSPSGYQTIFSSQSFEGNDGRILFVTDSIGFVIVHDSSNIYKVLRTRDAGQTWSQRLAVGLGPLQCIDFLDADNGFVAGRSGVCYKTTDGGSTWTGLAINGPLNANSLDFVDAQTAYIGCDNGVILRTLNGGLNWFDEVVDSSQNIVYVKAINPTMAYVLCADSVLYKRDYVADAEDAQTPALRASIHPNPATDGAQIALPPGLLLREWTLYDLRGQVLQTGSSSTIDLQSLPKGVYLVGIRSNRGLQYLRLAKS